MSESGENSALYLLDVYAIVYRSYFAFLSRPLRNPSGRNVSAIYGFFKFLFQIFDQRNPRAFAAVFDSRGKTFRHRMYEAYKATRQKTPEDLIEQVPTVEEILKALGVPLLRAEGYEADDVIATLATRCKEEGRPCYIISGDKDLLQLVGGPVRAIRPQDGGSSRELGPEEVAAEWGVEPERILDYLSLTGDSSDNVPGVPGVGEKTALKLLAQFGSLEGIYSSLETVKPDSLRIKLESGRESAELSRKLITLSTDVDVGLASLGELELAGLDRSKANGIFLREGMRSLAVKTAEPDLFGAERPFAAAAASTGAASAGAAAEPPRAEPAAFAPPAAAEVAKLYLPITTEADLAAAAEACIASGAYALDTETDGLDPDAASIVGFSLCCEPGKSWYIPLASPDAVCLPLEAAITHLAGLLSSDALLVGHNLKFDLHVLARLGLTSAKRVFDTMVAAWVLDAESNSFSLESLSERLLGLTGLEFEEVAGKDGNFALVPLDRAVAYAAEDADFTFRLYSLLSGELARQNLDKIFSGLEMPLLPILVAMERRGISVNAGELRAYGVELESELRGLESEVHGLVGRPFNLASTKQLQEILFVERRLPAQKRTKTGYSTDTSVLEDLAALDPVPRLILRHRTLSKLKNTYVDTLADLAERHGKVHTTYLQTGAATGRLSSKDPNLQNIPIRDEEGRRIRAAFTAAPGQLLISADYAQIELAVMAHLSQDPNLIEAFRQGVDIHRRTAAFIFGIDENDVVPDQRRVAKTINFGVIYGMSAFRLARDLGIPNGRAQAFIDAYFTTYAGVASFIQKTISETEETGYATTLFGRRRKIPGIDSRNKTERQAAQRVAVNTPIQGTAADIVKMSMIAVEGVLAREMPEVSLLLQVHDELVLEAPEALAGQAGELVRRTMEGAATLSVPLRVSVEAAFSWGAMH